MPTVIKGYRNLIKIIWLDEGVILPGLRAKLVKSWADVGVDQVCMGRI